MTNQNIPPQIGEIYMMDFSGIDSEQTGVRPGVIFQNNVGNTHSPNIIALPLTSSIKKRGQPTHVFLHKSTGLPVSSMVLCENPQQMSKTRVGHYLTKLEPDHMKQVATASLLATSALGFLDQETLLSVWEKAVVLNKISH